MCALRDILFATSKTNNLYPQSYNNLYEMYFLESLIDKFQGCVRCGTSRCRCRRRTELTEESGTGIDVVPSFSAFPGPVLEVYRMCPAPVRTGTNEYVQVRTNICTGTAGTGVGVLPNLLTLYVQVLISHRTFRSFRYSGIDVVPTLPKSPVPVSMSYRTYRSLRYRY